MFVRLAALFAAFALAVSGGFGTARACLHLQQGATEAAKGAPAEGHHAAMRHGADGEDADAPAPCDHSDGCGACVTLAAIAIAAPDMAAPFAARLEYASRESVLIGEDGSTDPPPPRT